VTRDGCSAQGSSAATLLDTSRATMTPEPEVWPFNRLCDQKEKENETSKSFETSKATMTLEPEVRPF
jgi:hypothetical protein